MNSEEQFKDSLKKVLESKEFPLDESNWEKAMLIRDAEKTKKRILPFLIAALLLITGGVASYFYFTAADTATIAEHTNQTGNSNPAEQPLTTAAEPAENTVKTLPADPSPTKQAAVTELPVIPAAQPAAEKGAVNPASEKPNNAPAIPQKNEPAAVADVKHPVKPQDQKTGAEIIAAVPAVKNTKPEPQKNTAKNPVKTQPVAATTNDAGISDKTKEQGNVNNEGAIPVASKAPEMVGGSNTIPPVEKPAGDTDKGTEHLTSIESPDAVTPAADTFTPAAKTPPVAAKADSAASINPDHAPEANPRIVMCFEAGASFLTGWKNPGKTDAQGFNPVIGINYYNYLAPNLAVSFGAQYTTVSGLNYTNHISKVTRYSLGEESDVTAITPEKLHYLLVPIRLHYAMNAKNTFGAGFNVAYLLTVDSKMETYHERLKMRENYKSSQTQGYTDGFKSFDTQLSVFYRRRIYKNLSLHAELMYGLTDIKDNAFFNSSVYERNSGFKMTLMYNLFK